MARANGKVKWFNDDKGFGFITPDGGGKDLFVHYKSIDDSDQNRRTLVDGERVSFVRTDTPKGPAATEVRRTPA